MGLSPYAPVREHEAHPHPHKQYLRSQEANSLYALKSELETVVRKLAEPIVREIAPKVVKIPNGDSGKGVKGDKGDPGNAGPEGQQGQQGAQGPQGDTGAQGQQGAPGQQGPQGDIGPQGPEGDQGIQGPQGLQGIQGPQGDDGQTGPEGPQGPPGTPATAIKLDDLLAPDDNTDLDASTAKHGLMPKFPGGTTTFLRADGTYAAPTAQAADPSYSPGSFTVATETAKILSRHLKLTTTQRATLQGTATLRLT